MPITLTMVATWARRSVVWLMDWIRTVVAGMA
jgi:hypothetical protein